MFLDFISATVEAKTHFMQIPLHYLLNFLSEMMEHPSNSAKLIAHSDKLNALGISVSIILYYLCLDVLLFSFSLSLIFLRTMFNFVHI